VIYLYAIAEELDSLPDVRGLGGAPLARRSVEGLDLVVSEHDGAELDASEEAVLTHARVVEGLVERSAALLPARFGRGFRDEDALREAIAGRAAQLRDALAQVRGCVEVGVRVLAPEAAAAPSAAGSGRAYMEERLARAEETERLARELHEPLAALARSATRTVGATPRLLLSGAYLVEPGALDAFRRRVSKLEAAHPELTFVSTGPWPPYSFAPGGET
jgi:Gas vesicle synthesis protein GvpL/GvpF